MSRIVVFINFFNFAACELMMYPPCNELGLLFITRAVFSNALLKTAAHFCPLVKCFLLFSKETVKRKIPRTFLWYEVSFLSSYLNDIEGSPPFFSAYLVERFAYLVYNEENKGAKHNVYR